MVLINDIKELENALSGTIENLKEAADYVMELSLKVTKSEHCYIAYVDPANKDSVGISFTHMTGACQYYADIGEARFPVRKDGTYGGLLGYSLDTGLSFFIKNPESHPAAHGIPPGHVPVDQFLSVPVINQGEIIGQIVLGNPEEDYCDHDLEKVNKIAEIYGDLLRKVMY